MAVLTVEDTATIAQIAFVCPNSIFGSKEVMYPYICHVLKALDFRNQQNLIHKLTNLSPVEIHNFYTYFSYIHQKYNPTIIKNRLSRNQLITYLILNCNIKDKLI